MNTEKKIIGKECRFAVHIPSKSRDVKDLHLVKEIIHYDDGTTEPNIAYILNLERPFWVTKKNFRDHEQKKECESLDKLTKYTCTQSELRFQVAKALDKAYSPLQLQQLAASPYLYGSDISSTSIIKHIYQSRHPELISMYSTAVFDIETDMVNGTDDPIMATLVMPGKLWHVALRSFFKGYDGIEERYRAAVKKYIGPSIEKHNFQIEFLLVDTPVELIKAALKKHHEWMPDFSMIWNINFDIPRLLDTLKKYGVNAEDIFCHPDVPVEQRYVRYKKGSTKKITASGQVKPKNPSEQWHSLICPAGFLFIDQMSAYRFIRLGGQEEQEYGLDHILKVNGLSGKLSFVEADHLKSSSADWHRFMQEKYPFEYAVYNNYDCIGGFELELKNSDIAMSAPGMCGITDFTRFDSQTKRFADAYHYYLLEQGYVIGTIPPRKEEAVGEEEAPDYIGDSDDDYVDSINEDDDEEIISLKDDVMSLRGWIN